MVTGIVTAGGGHAWETAVVTHMSRPGAPLTVVRRCADIADVLAVAATGQIGAALVAADLRRLDSETVSELAAFGVLVVAVARAGDGRRPELLARIGVAAVLFDDATPDAIARAVHDALVVGGDRPVGEHTGTVVGSDPSRAFETAAGDAAAAGAPGARFVPPGLPDRAEPEKESGAIDAPRRRSARTVPWARDGRPAHAAHRRRRARRESDSDAQVVVAPQRGTSTVDVEASPRRDTADGAPHAAGRIVAVWGPAGAPGRSTVAMGLADRVVAAGSSAMLIDADVYGGVLASAFGLLDESAGLAGACRLASGGRLGPSELAGLCWQVRDRFTLLTGIARADRWPELRPSAIPLVLDTARGFADLVIVDCASVVETDEEISFDTLAPRRNGATLAVLAAADIVIAVGAADPPGMERFARGYVDLTATVADVDPLIVFNRVRPTAASESELREASRRFCGAEPVAFLPEDRELVDLAWRRGVTLSLVASKSPLVGALDRLASVVAAAPVGR